MSAAITYFDPQPTPAERPARMASPFAAGEPGPLGRRAADQLIAILRRAELPGLDAPGGGKMFGVLVVEAADGRIGWLRAFSGMLAGRWHHDGWAPPLFDAADRDAFWPAGEAELAVLEARHRALVDGAEVTELRASLAALTAQHHAALAALRARHDDNRARRKQARAGADDTERHALDQQSRGDTAERRRLDAAHRDGCEPMAARLRALDHQRVEVERQRAERSRQLWQQILDGYRIADRAGVTRSLRALFAPDEPPGGAGDCAAPKLLGHAHAHRLRPLALAELWWGAPPPTGGRHAGQFYPACRGKCGPILPHMLAGLPVDDAPVFGAAAIAADQPRLVYQDAWLLVVDKPCGLLSVPGRHAQLRDSVLVRLRARHPDASVVHRLDLDTSGLLLVALDAATHAALQRQFARRQVAKRYVAWVDGELVGDAGEIDLPLRVDLDDRPRQIVDPVHGKSAQTGWRVLARGGGRTRVALIPHTGRTHQLRVHAAHPAGLGAPIVGDRLYGREGARLLLHAEALGFTHPHTGEWITLERPAPF